MKNIFKILILFTFISCKAQTIVNINTYNIGDNTNKYFKDLDNNFTNFVGTWENTTGDITFRVILWKESMKPLVTENNSFMDRLYGKFQIIQNADLPNEIIIHNSVKYFPQNDITSTWSIFGTPYNSTVYGAYLEDTCANGGSGVLEGNVKMEITNLGNTPLNAHWTVKSVRPLHSGENFSVPMNIVLTKVN
ncbi:DUF6705 family protein [Flavobacterium lacisediminis]|uniref:DUF6705 domain-containing protein n=1 Tax=Flavobacterium lacisediminis TaxID=2989705 RepID=A0ABT3EEP0_9FLAO|nr:DUF6705 family protein [Flavobacterium lacisediminis]MCW1147045.1 hypothetical protein [Flavobacterium lacisediminis]